MYLNESDINVVLFHEAFCSGGIDMNLYPANLNSLYSPSAVLQNAFENNFHVM